MKKYYTLQEANATLPLLRSILRDVTALANEMGERSERLNRLRQTDGLDQAHQEEVQQLDGRLTRVLEVVDCEQDGMPAGIA